MNILHKKIAPALVITVAVLSLLPTMLLFFSQDDLDVLQLFHKNPADLALFFSQGSYRLYLGVLVLLKPFSLLFHYEPLPYFLVSLALFPLVPLLIYSLANRLFRNQSIALISGLVAATAYFGGQLYEHVSVGPLAIASLLLEVHAINYWVTYLENRHRTFLVRSVFLAIIAMVLFPVRTYPLVPILALFALFGASARTKPTYRYYFAAALGMVVLGAVVVDVHTLSAIAFSSIENLANSFWTSDVLATINILPLALIQAGLLTLWFSKQPRKTVLHLGFVIVVYLLTNRMIHPINTLFAVHGGVTAAGIVGGLFTVQWLALLWHGSYGTFVRPVIAAFAANAIIVSAVGLKFLGVVPTFESHNRVFLTQSIFTALILALLLERFRARLPSHRVLMIIPLVVLLGLGYQRFNYIANNPLIRSNDMRIFYGQLSKELEGAPTPAIVVIDISKPSRTRPFFTKEAARDYLAAQLNINPLDLYIVDSQGEAQQLSATSGIAAQNIRAFEYSHGRLTTVITTLE